MKANFTPPSLLRTWQGSSLHLSWGIFSITASQRPPGSELMLLLQKCIWLLAAIAREVNSPCAFLSTWQGTLLCVGLSHVIYANAVISFSRCFLLCCFKIDKTAAGIFVSFYLCFKEWNTLHQALVHINNPSWYSRPCTYLHSTQEHFISCFSASLKCSKCLQNSLRTVDWTYWLPVENTGTLLTYPRGESVLRAVHCYCIQMVTLWVPLGCFTSMMWPWEISEQQAS